MQIFKLSSYQRHYIDFLLAMTEKEIKVRYKFAVLGFLWIVLNPLLQMMVMGFVFQFFVPVQIDNYFLFLFVGLLPWNFFSMTVTKNTPMIINERSLIQKAKFPRESIILSIVLSNLFHFLIALGLLTILLIGDKVLEGYSIFNVSLYSLRMLWMIPLVVWLSLLTSGLSLLFASLNVKYRDVNFMVQAIMPLWFYATPIVYTLDLLPQRLHWLFYFNPLTSLIELFHFVLLNKPITSLPMAMFGLGVGVISMLIGFIVFKKESPYFDDWV